MRQSLYVVFAALLVMLGGQPLAARANDGFADQMRVQLGTNPAGALSQADAELQRLASAAPDQATLAARAEAIWVRAQALARLGDPSGAQQALAQLNDLGLRGVARTRMRGNFHLLSGFLARQANDFPVALTQYRAAQQQFIAAQDRRGQGQVLSAIGALYTDVSDNENAFRYLRMAEEVYRNDDFYNVSLNNNFGVAHVNARQTAAAVSRYTRAAALADRLGLTAYAATVRANIAIAQLELGRNAAAAATLARIDETHIRNNPALRVEILRTQAVLALRTGDSQRAVALLNQIFGGLDLDNTNGSYRFSHAAAYQIYSELGRFHDALQHMQALRRLEEADLLLRTSNRTALLAAQFGYDAQEAQIDRLKAEQLERSVAFERQRNAMQRTFIIALATGSLMLLGVLLVLLITAVRARNRARADEMRMSILNEQLQHALNAKSEFLASTSHEMRTPLNGIVGMTQILLADAKLTPKVREQIELVSNAGTAMRGLVDDLLDVSKIERGGFTVSPNPTSIAPIIRDVVAQAQANAQLDGLALDLDITVPDDQVMIDGARLRQVVVNLVGNAIKFTDNGSIHVAAYLMERSGQQPMLRLSVRDTGAGIAPEWQASIFELFRQVDNSRTRRYGGTGLGLAICRQIVEAMGGTIRVESAVGIGSTFIVDIPYIKAAATPAATDEMVKVADILVAAVNPLRASLLTTMIERSGRSCTSVAMNDLASTLDKLADKCARHMLIIDAQALADIPVTPDHPAILAGLPVIIAGDTGSEIPHPLETIAQRAAFALNALLPLVQRADGSAPTATATSRLQTDSARRILRSGNDAHCSTGERSVGTG